ncbi:MAG: hypothetical protein JST40_06930 [Armatimonadetes bacterium]|nr:hypothetical protein [Armatimonadota bacterium]
MRSARKPFIVASLLAFASVVYAQIPDMLTSMDAGTRAMGMGSSIGVAGAETTSALNNPAGLGYLEDTTFSLAVRNLPGSHSIWRTSFRNPNIQTDHRTGGYGLSHIGLALPLKMGGRKLGTVGISYTIGGYIHDERVSEGNLVVDPSTNVTGYNETIKAQTDYFTVGLGRTSGDMSLAYGLGVVFATNYILNTQTYTLNTAGGSAASPPLNVSGQGTGIGVVAGIQYIPPTNQNLSIGASVRTPISMSSNRAVDQYYDKIPGKASIGIAYRRDGLRGDRDYMILGAQVDGYFQNERRQVLARKRAVNIGVGAEYNYLFRDARIPIRLGYAVVPSAGSGFSDRNALTFGFGYRPFNSPISVELNFANAGGGTDSSIMFNYRVQK